MASQEIPAKIVRIESQTTPLQQFFSVERHPSQETVFAVRAKGLAPLVSGVRYEKDEQDLRLYFTLQKGLDLTVIVGDAPHSHNCALLSASFGESDPASKLYSRISSASEHNAKREICRLLLSRRDFRDTGTNPKDIPRVFELTRRHVGQSYSCLALFETRAGAQALLQSDQKILHDVFAFVVKAERKGTWSLSLARWDSIERAVNAFSLFL